MLRDEIDLSKIDEKELQRLSGALLGSRHGSKGGKKRAANLTPKQRQEIARKAAKARWGKNAGDKADKRS